MGDEVSEKQAQNELDKFCLKEKIKKLTRDLADAQIKLDMKSKEFDYSQCENAMLKESTQTKLDYGEAIFGTFIMEINEQFTDLRNEAEKEFAQSGKFEADYISYQERMKALDKMQKLLSEQMEFKKSIIDSTDSKT